MKTMKKIGGGIAITMVGLATAVLFQNCSGGTLPAGLDQSSTSAAAVALPPDPLSMNPLVSSLTTSAATGVRVSGGSGTYTFTSDCGAVTHDLVSGYLFTAPAAVPTGGICNISVSDGSQTKTAAVTITAAVTTPVVTQPTVTAVSKVINEWYESGNKVHGYSDDPNFNLGRNYGGKYRLMTDGTSGAVKFYRCTLPANGVMFYFDTTDENCEGQATSSPTLIGYIYSTPDASRSPLYRFNINLPAWGQGVGIDHFDSLSNVPPYGFSLDNIIGYVPNN